MMTCQFQISKKSDVDTNFLLTKNSLTCFVDCWIQNKHFDTVNVYLAKLNYILGLVST